MRYVGSKRRLARRIAAHVLTSGSRAYWEPFCGGLNSFSVIAPSFRFALGSDSCADLIKLWHSAYLGWVPPERLSEEEYAALREGESSALRGFVGYGCSYGGKWFGGYARGGMNADGTPRNHCGESRRAVIDRISPLRKASTSVAFECRDYRSLRPLAGTVIYCDPPYAGTTGYHDSFDTLEFWSTAQTWAERGAAVFVSEYVAPAGWRVLDEFPHRSTVALAPDRHATVERLFTYDFGDWTSTPVVGDAVAQRTDP